MTMDTLPKDNTYPLLSNEKMNERKLKDNKTIMMTIIMIIYMCTTADLWLSIDKHGKQNMYPYGTLSDPYGRGAVQNKLSSTNATLFVPASLFHMIYKCFTVIDVKMHVIYSYARCTMYTICDHGIIHVTNELNVLWNANHDIRSMSRNIIMNDNMYSNDCVQKIVHAQSETVTRNLSLPKYKMMKNFWKIDIFSKIRKISVPRRLKKNL